jgi:hypothetical protein
MYLPLCRGKENGAMVIGSLRKCLVCGKKKLPFMGHMGPDICPECKIDIATEELVKMHGSSPVVPLEWFLLRKLAHLHLSESEANEAMGRAVKRIKGR